MRITKRDRDEAILLCALSASTPKIFPCIAREIDASFAAEELATFAYQSAPWILSVPEAWADAEARLREGWPPGGVV